MLLESLNEKVFFNLIFFSVVVNSKLLENFKAEVHFQGLLTKIHENHDFKGILPASFCLNFENLKFCSSCKK